ncbi:MAG TPA: LytTR family DNA-binding domain-containing protein [Terracidiphilus sp.]|jgi:two-component system LytT family response regulator|nr:LytTR family DNA-binding domain-containing protein [Terracidiphilus sp.]
MMRAVIADDEVLARQKLRTLLRSEPDVEIVGECATAAETIQLVHATTPDLLFLDIRMPDMDGFDIAGSLSLSPNLCLPQIVLTTAYDQYAVRAFEIHAADYLLKPFTAERLHTAVQRVRDRTVVAGHKATTDGAFASNGSSYMTRIVFKSRGRIIFLPVEEIRWIGAEENYVRICAGSESHLLRDTMARLETRLDPNVFLRVHRSSIVNLHYVKEVKNESDGESLVVLTSGEVVSMSRTYRSRLYKLLHR